MSALELVMVDYALVLGATGTVLGLGSLAYAHAQALAAKRQAEASQRVALLELNRSVTESVHNARAMLLSDEGLEREYLASAPPQLRAAFEEFGGLPRVVLIRNFLDGFHDAWHLRRTGIVEDHYWRRVSCPTRARLTRPAPEGDPPGTAGTVPRDGGRASTR